MAIGRYSKSLRLVFFTALVTAIATAIVADLYPRAKAIALGLIPSDSGPISALTHGISVDASVVQRGDYWHGVLFFGHRDYLVIYRVTVKNFGAIVPARPTMQFTSRDGVVVTIAMPPISNSSVAGVRQGSRWALTTEDEAFKSAAIEFDAPPPNTYYSFGVGVVSRNDYVAEDDLLVHLDLPSGLIEARSHKVSSK